MKNQDRRQFLQLLGAASLFVPFGFPRLSFAAGGNVVIVGGGFGGATCANYIRRYNPGIGVTLIEPNAKYITCPFSNTVIAGMNSMDFITHGYDGLSGKRQVKIINDMVVSIDPAGKKIATNGGQSLTYDHLVLSPGIDFRWDQIEGYDEAVSEVLPHAWKAGPQTILLRQQLEAMADGGVVIIAPPPKPFRAPPAPYERASLIAHYLKNNKPKSKVLIIDANDDFAKQELFMQGWEKNYPGMIEWIKSSQVVQVDAGAKTVKTMGGDSHKGDVINIIPPQQSGIITQTAGLTDGDGWCKVDQRTFESAKQKDIYIIGDSCVAGDMPKTGFAASSQAKVCAAAVVSSLSGQSMPEPTYNSAIYSLISPKYAISKTAVYRLKGGRITMVSHGESSKKGKKKFRSKEARYAKAWYKAITSDAFAK